MSPSRWGMYAVHVAFWTAFGITNWIARRRRDANPTAPAVTSGEARTAPHSGGIVAFHGLAFGVMYFGIANAVFGRLTLDWFPGHDLVGLLIIALGAFITCWARLYFSSWRFRAQLDAGHQLATGGPYAMVRHPIYLGLDLLALGTAVWMPTVILWGAAALMALGSDMRSRAEERLLTDVFGGAYRDYRRRTWRLVPFIY
ncbi:MAG: methyltransferase family protein [Gemmatimonadaceae bacterium]